MSEVLDKIGQQRQSFKWNAKREEAALLLSLDELTDVAICEKLKIARSSLSLWKLQPEFIARIDEHIAQQRIRVRSHGIAIVENRVAQIQRRHDLMNQIVAERAASEEMQSVPGGRTGLMVKRGEGCYEPDNALLKQFCDHEKQAAQELSQWAEKSVREITGAGGGPVRIKYDLAKLTKDDWLAIREVRNRTKMLPVETPVLAGSN